MAAPLFHVPTICTNIVSNQADADSIIAQRPEVLSEICNLSPKDYKKGFIEHLTNASFTGSQCRRIHQVADRLYATSLLNSRYNDTMNTLEKDMPTFLALSTKEHFTNLIQAAETVLSRGPQDVLSALQATSSECAGIAGDINRALGLFFYVDEETIRRVSIITSDAKHYDGSPLFPICKKDFRRLCQNLRTNQHEKAKLIPLRNQLIQKANELRQKMAQFYAPSSENSLPLSRKGLFNRETGYFWQAGERLLDNAFRTTFELKEKKKNFYISSPFNLAVGQTAKSTLDWSSLTFNHFLNAEKPLGALPDRFTATVWANYSGKMNQDDLGGFMKQILSSLPEEAFLKLATDLKASQDKAETICKTFTQHIKMQNGGNRALTFMELRNWLTNDGPT
jgi:hypothetical protein